MNIVDSQHHKHTVEPRGVYGKCKRQATCEHTIDSIVFNHVPVTDMESTGMN